MRKKILLNWFKILRFIFGPRHKPCKPTVIRIQKTVEPNGTTVDGYDLMLAKNKLRGLHEMNKDRKTCQYNYVTHKCYCGVTLEKLKNDENCPLKNI